MKKIERAITTARAAVRQSSRELLHLIAECELHARPDLSLVSAGDTDAVTYRDIQMTLALADGDFDQAERLEAQHPACRRGPALTGDPRRDVVLVADWMSCVLVPGVCSQIEREHRAVDRARARLARGCVRQGAAAESPAGPGARRRPPMGRTR